MGGAWVRLRAGYRSGRVGWRPPPPPPRTKWIRRVPHPVLIGHAASQVARGLDRRPRGARCGAARGRAGGGAAGGGRAPAPRADRGPARPACAAARASCPLSTRGGTRLVRLVRGRGGGSRGGCAMLTRRGRGASLQEEEVPADIEDLLQVAAPAPPRPAPPRHLTGRPGWHAAPGSLRAAPSPPPPPPVLTGHASSLLPY